MQVDTEHFVIHAREENGELKVYVNRKDPTGKEIKPGGYILGHNAIIRKIE